MTGFVCKIPYHLIHELFVNPCNVIIYVHLHVLEELRDRSNKEGIPNIAFSASTSFSFKMYVLYSFLRCRASILLGSFKSLNLINILVFSCFIILLLLHSTSCYYFHGLEPSKKCREHHYGSIHLSHIMTYKIPIKMLNSKQGH